MIRLRNVTKSYDTGPRSAAEPAAAPAFIARQASGPADTPDLSEELLASPDSRPAVLRGVDWDLAEGETAVIRGESGSGKTTLLNLVAGLDRPTSGEVHVAGRRLDLLDDDALARFRRHTVGLIFQEYHLEAKLTALENVALPLLLDDQPLGDACAAARAMLESLRMDPLADKPVALLSGGQCQRVVVARALVRRPPLLLADEPTANLDESTARVIFGLLDRYQRDTGATMVLVSHDRLALEHPGWRPTLCANGKVEYTDNTI